MTQVFAIEGTEDEVNFFLLVRDIAERSEVATEMLHWNDTTRWVYPDWFVVGAQCDKWCVRFGTERIKDLAISKEKHDTRLHNILENEVLVVIANFDNV
jgi:hypothetical protein